MAALDELNLTDAQIKKLSTQDLQNLSVGKIEKISTEGLKILSGEQASIDREIPTVGGLPQQPKQEPSYSIPEKLIGAGEAALSVGSAALSPFTAIPVGLYKGEKYPEALQSSVIQPKTPAGQQYTEAIGNVLEESKLQGLMGMPIIGRGTPMISPKTIVKQSQNVPKTQLLQEANKLGFKVKPSEVEAGQIPRALESFSGKIKTENVLSASNNEALGNITRKYLNLPEGAPLTPDYLSTVRDKYNVAYEEVASLPSVQTQSTAGGLIKTTGTRDGAEILNELKIAREDRNAAERALNNPNLPNRTEIRNEKTALTNKVNQLEVELENLAKLNKRPDLIKQLKQSRQEIAKTYAVENALIRDNVINPKSLVKQVEKGVPISGELKTAAKFASEYPNVNKAIGETPSPLSIYDVGATAYGLGSGNKLLAMLAPLRVGARAAITNPLTQRAITSNIGKPSLAPTVTNALNLAAPYTPYMGLLNFNQEEQ